MFKIQSTYISVLHRALLVIASVVWNFVVLDIVYADQQSYIYVSDLIQKQKNINSEREIWHYQHEIPLTFRDKDKPYQKQYTYLPPTQKIGSNPFSNAQYKYQFTLNNKAANHTNVTGSVYNYLPPVQKIGSNPFSNPQYKYQFTLNNNAANHTNVAGNVYNYLPPVQKIGSNPFIKPNNQYVTQNNTIQSFASSCGCEKPDYLGVFATY